LHRTSLQAFAIALVVTTQLVLLPSEPYRRGMFEFGLLSWFHSYVAVCTAGAAAALSLMTYSPRHLIWFAAFCAALMAPLAQQALGGAGFLSGSFSILGLISEAQSPYKLYTETFGPSATLSYYSALLFAAPLLVAFFIYRVTRERTPQRLYFAIAAAFGLLLLLTQFRLHYFGWFALVTGPLLVIDSLRTRLKWHSGVTFTATFAAVALAFQPALRERLLLFNAPGSAPDYASVLPLYLELMRYCAADPGLVLASSDDGSGILFHTDCSVIANNFILTPADEKHINETRRLLHSTPAKILDERPDVKYVLLRARDFLSYTETGIALAKDSPIAQQLLTNAEPPPDFELLKTVVLEIGPSDDDIAIFARLYRVRDPEGAIAVSSDEPSTAVATNRNDENVQ
jgi:hypothetical protein